MRRLVALSLVTACFSGLALAQENDGVFVLR